MFKDFDKKHWKKWNSRCFYLGIPVFFGSLFCIFIIFAAKKCFLLSISNGKWSLWGFWLFWCLLIWKLGCEFGAGTSFILFLRIQIPVGILEWLVRPASLQCGLIFIWKLWREREHSTRMLSQPCTCPSLTSLTAQKEGFSFPDPPIWNRTHSSLHFLD